MNAGGQTKTSTERANQQKSHQLTHSWCRSMIKLSQVKGKPIYLSNLISSLGVSFASISPHRQRDLLLWSDGKMSPHSLAPHLAIQLPESSGTSVLEYDLRKYLCTGISSLKNVCKFGVLLCNLKPFSPHSELRQLITTCCVSMRQVQ